MAIETQTISADNVVETSTRVFATPQDKSKIDLLTISQPTDLDLILTKVDSIQNPIQNKGTFDASVGTFPGDAKSGWLFKVSVAGTIDGMDLTPGDVIFAIEDVTSASSSTHWVKVDNTDGADILRQTALDTDVTLSGNSNTKIATQKAVKTYIDTSLDSLNQQLLTEIENLALAATFPTIEVSDWINIEDDGANNSIITLPFEAKGIIRVYIEDWGDIIRGWTFTPETVDVIFEANTAHTGKRCIITYIR